MQDIDEHTHTDCTKARLCNAENCKPVDFYWCATEVHPDTQKMITWGTCDPSKCEGTDGTELEIAIREEYLKKEDFQWCATEVDSDGNMKKFHYGKCTALKQCESSSISGGIIALIIILILIIILAGITGWLLVRPPDSFVRFTKQKPALVGLTQRIPFECKLKKYVNAELVNPENPTDPDAAKEDVEMEQT